MAKLAPDQAEGLRRLFVGDMRRMIALVGGATNQMLSAQLAIALARQGKKILLLDETLAAGDQHAALGVRLPRDLDAVMAGRTEIEGALVRTANGVDLLAGGRHGGQTPKTAMEARIGLVNAFYRVAGNYDVVLVDTMGSGLGKRPSFAWACQDVIVLCDDHSHSLTEAYAHIKALHQAGERRFHLLFEGASEGRVQTLFRSVAAVSRRHLQLMPESLGNMPESGVATTVFFERLAASVLQWPLPENKTGHFPVLMRRLLRAPAKSSPAMVR